MTRQRKPETVCRELSQAWERNDKRHVHTQVLLIDRARRTAFCLLRNIKTWAIYHNKDRSILTQAKITEDQFHAFRKIASMTNGNDNAILWRLLMIDPANDRKVVRRSYDYMAEVVEIQEHIGAPREYLIVLRYTDEEIALLLGYQPEKGDLWI